MKFLHTADWHIGKKLHGFSLLKEQQYAFDQIEKIAQKEKVDAIVIAGDIYDRSVPSEEAVKVLNEMLKQLNLTDHFPILAINGNHDSAIRLNSGGPWYKSHDFYLNTKLADAFTPITIKDTQFFLLPSIELTTIRAFFKKEEVHDIQEGMKLIIKKMQSQFISHMHHVLVAHFFAAGKLHHENDTEVGGLNAIPLDILNAFDYVALGHLHGKNALKDPKIKYSGSPIKFSISEANDEKGVWIVDTDVQTTKMAQWYPLKQLNDIVVLQEDFKTLTSPQFYQKVPNNDFVAIELTNKEIIPNVMNKLRLYYPKIISFKRQSGHEELMPQSQKSIQKLAPLELLKLFFKEVTGNSLSKEQLKFAKEMLSKAEKEE